MRYSLMENISFLQVAKLSGASAILDVNKSNNTSYAIEFLDQKSILKTQF